MSPRSGAGTRDRILDVAEALILDHGYAATSIDQIIAGVGITKGAFFYHYKAKKDLAQALIDRFARADHRLLHETMARAENLSRDPLQQLLIFTGLFIETAEKLEEPYPGCLFASYCYESGQFDADVLAVIEQAMLEWRHVLGDKMRAAIEAHPYGDEIDVDGLADMFTAVIEGAFIMSRVFKDPRTFAQQMRHYRRYLELVFGQQD